MNWHKQNVKFNSLIKQLFHDTDWQKRADAARELGIMKEGRSVNLLCRSLRSEEDRFVVSNPNLTLRIGTKLQMLFLYLNPKDQNCSIQDCQCDGCGNFELLYQKSPNKLKYPSYPISWQFIINGLDEIRNNCTMYCSCYLNCDGEIIDKEGFTISWVS